jgi:hypothetical protein
MRFGYRSDRQRSYAAGAWSFTQDFAGRGEAEELTSLSAKRKGSNLRTFGYAFMLLFCSNAFMF